mmetsp:Transcript_85338/g.198408  ORF Transcript_85338/g.198408 Transcript_85338/m.198408 type:complete len:141 (+) Transcript_85338:7-429(+)
MRGQLQQQLSQLGLQAKPVTEAMPKAEEQPDAPSQLLRVQQGTADSPAQSSTERVRQLEAQLSGMEQKLTKLGQDQELLEEQQQRLMPGALQAEERAWQTEAGAQDQQAGVGDQREAVIAGDLRFAQPSAAQAEQLIQRQ